MWWNKKEVETETPIDVNNEVVELPLYKRIKDLHEKVRAINRTGKLHDVNNDGNIYEEWIGFDSNLGKRLIWLDAFSYSISYTFQYYNADYDKVLQDVTKDSIVFSMQIKPDEIKIKYPKYKINAEQITPEQINNAIKEFEEVVNAEYEKYLINEQYHKMQEEKLANLL